MGKRQILISIIVLITLLLVLEAAWFFYSYQNTVRSTLVVSERQSSTPKNEINSVPEVITPVIAKLYFPMTNFDSRITVRWYGKLVKSTDKISPCGAAFSGYHNGDDLEITAAELNEDVPVYAIADGIVRELGRVSGYGGLLVLEVNLKGESYTVYYGHINLASTTLAVGENVKAGQRLASLGAACSVQTDGERKHLHFAMHKRAAIDVRGYVPTLSELANWIDPKEYLDANSAATVK